MNDSAGTMIEADGLTRYFGEFVAIKDLSFKIPRGQIVAFLGPNGAGKTTTMRILTGFLAADSGTAKIAGHDISTDRQSAAKKLGYLPENGPLYDGMTPLELLNYFGEARGLKAAQRVDRIDNVVQLCSLSEVLEKPIGKLSRGFRQRVGLAQALLHDPEVLIMDEPTAGLDPNQIHDFRTNLSSLSNSKTILLSTHILQEVEAVADRVILISEGRLVFDGAPDQLTKDGSMEEAFYRLTGKTNRATGSIADDRQEMSEGGEQS